jgi:hypothetical protein
LPHLLARIIHGLSKIGFQSGRYRWKFLQVATMQFAGSLIEGSQTRFSKTPSRRSAQTVDEVDVFLASET